MTHDLEFTGERFVPGLAGEIAHEHWHRYAFARRLVRGRRVLDIACGEGYGSALLAVEAALVTGVDVDEPAIAHAKATYPGIPGLNFLAGSAAALPLPDACADVIVSFETIEHLPRDLQPQMLAEFARVLAPGGMVLLSAPNPVEYSVARNYRNPFHLHEPDREEIARLLGAHFPQQRWFRQRRWFGSALWGEAGGATVEAWQGDAATMMPAPMPEAMYFIVAAAREVKDLPRDVPALSLFTDRDDAELARIDAEAARVLQLDALLLQRDAEIDRQTAHVRHLEELVAVRERLVETRDAELVAVAAKAAANAAAAAVTASALASAKQELAGRIAEGERLERALGAQERIIAYRQSLRWWLSLPWLRVRLWWQRIRGA